MRKNLFDFFALFVIIFILLISVESVYVTYSDPYILEEYYVSGTINYITTYADPTNNDNNIISFTVLKDDGTYKTFIKDYNKKYNNFESKQYDILHSIYNEQQCTLKIQIAIKRTLFFEIKLDDPTEYITDLF